MIRCKEDILKKTEEYGFLPFFKNSIDGFSIEEMCPPELWFAPDKEGPWEWKGPLARSGMCIYGKFFNGKAGFISREWAPHFLNYRRDGYDYDSRCDDGLSFYRDSEIYETVASRGSVLSKDLKLLCNYVKDGKKGFDTFITRLQMQGYICISDFKYMVDKHGKEYGWGVAVYSTPENILGCDHIRSAYCEDPKESYEKIKGRIRELFPHTAEKNIEKLMK
ncbi:MAG: hypothetical protein E7623_07150 [Ruminococcaceae bacterium]|nr:hypothetical protein [Oscillospiraceae bacterium]